MTRAPDGIETEKCPACGDAVFWAQTEDGKYKVLLDANLRVAALMVGPDGKAASNPVNGYAFVVRSVAAFTVHGDVCVRRRQSAAKNRDLDA